MNTDGNVEALRRYERDIDKAEKTQEEFEQKVTEMIFGDLEDLCFEYDVLAKEYDIPESFLDYCKEVL